MVTIGVANITHDIAPSRDISRYVEMEIVWYDVLGDFQI